MPSPALPLSQQPPTKAAWIPTDVVRYSTPSTAVAQGGPRVAQTQAAGNKRDTPESFTRGIPQQHRIPILLYRTSPKFPPLYLFFFGVQNRCFLFPEKKKRFWPQPGRRINSPSRAGKKQPQDKTHHFPTKEKAVLPVPSVRRHSTHRARAVSKRHSRQETACRQQLGCGPSRASEKTIPRRTGG